MNRFALACGCCAVVLVGCSRSKQTAAGDTSVSTTPPPAAGAAATLSLNDLAGAWNLRVMNEAGDSTLLNEVLNATATPTGWTIVRGTLPPNAVRPSVDGDSLITDGGPYPSALRKGVNVTTHSVWRLQGGKLVGTTTAHYMTNSADSVRHLRVEGTRAQ